MRPIKFRGRVPDSDKRDGGRIVFGSLVDHGESPHGYRYWIYPLEGDRNYPVEPDSVAQLVGYDVNGKEVYEDDILVDQDGLEYTISDVVHVELFCGGVYEPLYSTRYKFTLKVGNQ